MYARTIFRYCLSIYIMKLQKFSSNFYIFPKPIMVALAVKKKKY